MRVCLPCAERLQAKQAHLVWKTEWKRSGSKLLISDRQSSLSCDSIAVEWSPGVCELSLWHILWWGVKVSEKDSQMNTEIRKMAGGESLADQLCLKWPLYVSALRLSPLFHHSQLSGFTSVPHLGISEREFAFEKVAIIAKWLPCFSKHGQALRWSPVSGPGS